MAWGRTPVPPENARMYIFAAAEITCNFPADKCSTAAEPHTDFKPRLYEYVHVSANVGVSYE